MLFESPYASISVLLPSPASCQVQDSGNDLGPETHERDSEWDSDTQAQDDPGLETGWALLLRENKFNKCILNAYIYVQLT